MKITSMERRYYIMWTSDNGNTWHFDGEETRGYGADIEGRYFTDLENAIVYCARENAGYEDTQYIPVIYDFQPCIIQPLQRTPYTEGK